MKTDLVGNNIILEEVNKSNIENLYELENKSNNDSVSRKEFLKNIDFSQYDTYLMVKLKGSKKFCALFDLIDINYIDGYVYIRFCFDNLSENICSNIIYKCVDYLFNIYPIRKIYYELFLYEIDIAKHLKNVGFKIEVKYKDFKYYDNKYYSKYVLVLNRKDFYSNE